VKLSTIDIAIIVLYLAGTVIFGSWFGRKNRTPDNFMTAGGSISGWIVGISIIGTYISSISFLANPGKSYMADWNPFVFSLSLPIAAWVATRFFVPFYRKGGEVSAYNHLEKRFGPWARTYTVIMYLLYEVARIGVVLYLVALTMSEFLGLNIKLIIVITGGLVIIYTMFGGIEAVVWTDAIQTIILVLGALVTIVVLLIDTPGGATHIYEVATTHHKFSLGSFSASLSQPTFWVVLVYGIAINLQNFGINQSFVQRYSTAKSDRDAKASVWVGALSYLPISAIFFFIGTALFAFFTIQPNLLQNNMTGDAIYPYFIVHMLPIGITGLVIAAVFAAAMSTLSAAMNGSATIILQDIYKRYFYPQAGNKESMCVLYLTTFIWGVLGIGLAILVIGTPSALDTWWTLSGIFSGGMLGLFLLGLMTRVKNPAAITGVILGVLFIAWMSIPKYLNGKFAFLRSPFNSFLIVVFGTLAILLVGIFANWLRKELGKNHSAQHKFIHRILALLDKYS
jgi:SSS family solute:Na+ symporter